MALLARSTHARKSAELLSRASAKAPSSSCSSIRRCAPNQDGSEAAPGWGAFKPTDVQPAAKQDANNTIARRRSDMAHPCSKFAQRQYALAGKNCVGVSESRARRWV